MNSEFPLLSYPPTSSRSRTLRGGKWTALVATVALVLLSVAIFREFNPTYDVDQRVVEDWNANLAPALADLNELSQVSGLKRDGPAEVQPCSIDSGELFDLSAGRSWKAVAPGRSVEDLHPSVTPSTARRFLEIVDQLKRRGWRLANTDDLLGMERPPGLTYDSVDLTHTIGSVESKLSLQVFDDGVLAGLTYAGAEKACGGDTG